MTVTVDSTASLLANPANVALLRDLYAHARKVRAEHATYPGESVPSGGSRPTEHVWDVGDKQVIVLDDCLIYESHGQLILKVRVTDPRQVGQLLAAIGVLPMRFAEVTR